MANKQVKNSKTQVTITNPEPDLYVRTSPGSKYIVEYHPDICIGAASCAAVAPNTFRMDDENKAVVIDAEDVDNDEVVMAAAQSCPALAIVIKDAQTGKRIFPPD
jgi:ferredoxin